MHSPAPFADLLRRLHNIVRTGTVAEVDLTTVPALVRVQLVDGEDDSPGVRTDWRPWIELRAGDTRTWNPPTVGEPVICFSPSGELGGAYVLPGVSSASNPAPSDSPGKTVTKYPDGAVVEYDHAAHAMAVTLPAGGKATVTAPAEVRVITDLATLDATHTDILGSCTVRGPFAYQSGMTGQAGEGGGASAVITGTIETTVDVIAAGISLSSHTHGGIERGSQNTDAPGGGA
ncbi:MAG: hypothetical protein GAK30_01581 [Paracidovorax wautersii]|uniref:Gp5/Type VI secretion system Vgr protein OB-fold domain-containing protein n=1 Tax=Paracidovorax wautersii TaxID=1177982 RepID=A0A7V8FPR0_9BURK|nr:MAG: hypothetical protein GAK30_01581 [Paracidovorax wautersii]